jgi:hypothetical protein
VIDCILCSLPPTNLPLFSCRLQLPIPRRMNLLLTSDKHVPRRDVADCTIQATASKGELLFQANWNMGAVYSLDAIPSAFIFR